jgi:hypothetical protein
MKDLPRIKNTIRLIRSVSPIEDVSVLERRYGEHISFLEGVEFTGRDLMNLDLGDVREERISASLAGQTIENLRAYVNQRRGKRSLGKKTIYRILGMKQ